MPAQTVTSQDFAGFGGQKLERTMKIPQPPVQVHMGDTPVSYISNAKAAFNNPPPGFVKARPLKSKAESVKTNYSVSNSNFIIILTCFKQLGETATRYESAAMSQFCQHTVPQQPIYKNYNQRVDVITGQLLDKNDRNSGYERFTENTQSRTSANQSVLPSDMSV